MSRPSDPKGEDDTMANQVYAWPVAPTGAATQRATGSSDTAIAANSSRTSITLQNLGTVDLFVREDSTAPTASNAHYVLSKPTTSQGGDGGFLSIDGVTDAMKVGAAGSSYEVQIVEYVKS